jgi:DNA-binding CsgD family transcriptional regulator
MAALEAALAGEPVVVLVEGEGGVGKTRLAREFLATAKGQAAGALVACCPPFRQPHTLGPLVDAVREAVGDIRELALSELAGALRAVFPEWAGVLPPAPEPLEDATAARHRVFRAFAEVLDRLGTRVLVLEDAHWADEATLEFLLFLATRQPRRISLLVTSRPEDTPAGSLLLRLTRLASGDDGLRLTLQPLDEAQTGQLVSSMLAGGQVSEQFAAFLHKRTEGLPLAVEESVRLMGDRADLAFRRGSWARRHLPDIEVPPTVRDAVLERVARLSSNALTVLRAAAVLGEPATEHVLMSVAGLVRHQAQAGLGEALASGLLIENRSPAARAVVFRHALAARAVYDAIPPLLRRDLSRRAGQALQDTAPVPLARLAHHFREAGDSGRWSLYADQGADAALAAGDHATAAALLHELVANAGLPPGEVVRLACKVPILALPGYAAVAAITQSLRSALDSNALSAGQRAEACWRLGLILIDVGDGAAGAAELERAMPGLAHRPADAAYAMTLLGLPLHGLWPAAEHRRWLDRAAAAVADPDVSVTDRRKILTQRTTALLILGEDEGWADVAELPRDTADAEDAMILAVAWMNAGEAAMYWGRYAQAKQALTVALEMAALYHYPRVRDPVQVWQAHLDWFTGAWDGLPRRTEALLADLTDAEPLARLEATLTVGLLDAAVGATASAEHKLRLVLEEQAQRGIATYIQEPTAALARLRLADGHTEEALALTVEPVRVIAAKGIWIWATEVVPARVQALTTDGRMDEAAALVGAFTLGLRGRDAAAPKAALEVCRAMLAKARGQYARAATLFERAAIRWLALPRPYDALLAQEQQAHCLLRTDDGTTAALMLLTETRRGLDTLGASGDARRVAVVLREHGATPRRGRRGYGDELSPRELEVVRLLVGGSPVREIAETLFLSPKTVNCHLESARRKLNAPSRIALAVAASETGIVSDGPDSRLS